MIRLALAMMLSASPRADCNVAQHRFDNYLGDGNVGGFVAPRWTHHAVHIALAGAVAYAVHRVTGWGAVPAAGAGALAIGVVPHARGLLARRYPLNRADVVADITIASEPLIVAIGRARKTWVWAGVLAGLSYYVASCHASP
jgi:hypothetical protein